MRNIKNFGIALLIGSVLGGIIVILLMIGHNSRDKEISALNAKLFSEAQKTEVWKDNANQWHSKAETLELKNHQALGYLAKYDQQFANLAKDFQSVKANLKNVQYVGFTATNSQYNTTTTTHDTIVIVGKDTVTARKFFYLDSLGWYQTSGIVLPSGMLSTFTFQSHDSITTVVTKKKRFLRKPIYNQEIVSYNPHTQIGYNRSVIVNTRKRFFGLF